jgi:hypothetical protein
MSEPLRVALVAEGPTDHVVIEAALRSMLKERPFVLTQIFPEGSTSFGELGSGWVGVYRWCHKSARRGQGRLSSDEILFQNCDLLILHLDADVAGYSYNDGSITPDSTDGALPCALDCPPPSDTTNVLRMVLLSWCGEAATPARTVICMPSKSTEAWVVAALFPRDLAMSNNSIECHPNPESRLGQQPKANRLRKKKREYQERSEEMKDAWPRVAAQHALGEAYRFQSEFWAAVPDSVRL